MSKTHAPGPYEVVMVDDAAGKSGDKWIMIRNKGGAIATVYPARDGKETANLFAAAPELLEAAKNVLRDTTAEGVMVALQVAISKAEGR